MKMPTTSRLSSRCGAGTAAVLLCLGAVACFRGYDPAKIKCEDKSQCPSDYTCVRPSQQAPGTCTRGGADGSSPADVPQPSDGARDATLDGRIDGTGGVGGGSGGTTGGQDTPGAGGGGSGGATDAPGTGGGSGGSGGDAPLGTGGAPPADAGVVIGSPCTSNEQCPTKLCTDGVCCDKTCTGCNACSAARTGGVDGTCAPVAAGTDPHDFCADETAATPAKPCGNDGTCDGKGACRKVGSGQECGTASCSTDGSTFTPAPKCDGNGTCAPGTAQTCTPYECATTGCKKTCTATAQCDTGTYCDSAASVCVTKKTNGKPATQPVECASGIVADGVCCDKECTGCNACTATLNGQAASTTGTCMAVTAAKAADPHGVCPAASDPCGMDGTCNGAGSCHYAALNSDCGTPSCNASTSALTKSTCSANHTCTAGAATACPGLMACASASACKTGSCASDSDCATGNFCQSGTCTSKYDNGHSCTSGANNQCRSGNCVGTTCCSTACGECHTCANATGTCTTVNNGTACGTGVCNNGTCSACNAGVPCTVTGEECWNHATSCSTGVSQCVKTTQVSNNTSCGNAATCSGNQSIGHWTCQGGTCTQPAPTSCPYTCNTSTGACAGECTPGASQCVSSTQIRTCNSSYMYGAATSCGANKSCSGDQCACNTGTCGTSCIVCPSSTPFCVNGGCAACASVNDCPSGYLSCTGGACKCRVQSTANKIVNAGLDGGSYSPWVLPASDYFSASVDADNCPGSGVLQYVSASPYVNFYQCVSLGAGVSFKFGFRFSGVANCSVSYYSAAGCNSSYEIGGGPSYDATFNPQWRDSTPQSGTTPAGTVSVKVACYPSIAGETTYFDQFYLNTANGAF